jgi:hypothetical protein
LPKNWSVRLIGNLSSIGIYSFFTSRHRHKTYKILNFHQNCLNLWNMILFWFFGGYFVEICGKLNMRMKFVSRHVGCRTFFDCFTILWKNNELFSNPS